MKQLVRPFGGDLMRGTMRIAAMLVLVTTLSAAAEAAVLCAKPERDGTLNGSVKVRQVCKRNEVQLAPADVNFCCTSTTSTAVAPLRSARPRCSTPTARRSRWQVGRPWSCLADQRL